jgi:uncharacterized RDD family membrane protein YckC
MEVSKLNRFLAIFIDLIIAVIINAIFAFISGATGIGALFVVGYIFSYGYMLFREQVLNGQSVGHKVMGYKVVTEDGKSIKGDFLASFLRNILVVLIIDYFVMLFAKQRLGDNIAKTKVIKA